MIEGEICPDHIHMLVSIPPKMSVAGFMGYLKGKSSLMIFQKWGNMKFAYRNREFWCKGYYVDTIEHLGATVLRNGASKDDIVYFGPMGCRTGFYLIVFGDKTPADVYGLVVGMCEFILGYDGEIPGAKAAECGNYLEQNLSEAKYYVRRYLNELKENKRYDYPTATE